MKLNITYLLLLLVISPNLYGAAESSALALQPDELQVPELTKKWEQKTIPSKWVKKGNTWVEQSGPRSRQLATFIILGSDSTFNAYHFIESTLYGKELLYTPLKDDAEKVSLTSGTSEKIKQFGKSIRSSKLGSHLTYAPVETNIDFFDQNSKTGYKSQLLAGLIATQKDYKETQESGALKRSLAVSNALAHEIQKGTTGLAIRKKQIVEKKDAAESLKKEIEAFNPIISNEFVFYMNALIDIHQSEDQFFQANEFNSDGDVIDYIFSKADGKFILNNRNLTTKTKSSTEVSFDFSEFVKKNGRLPVEECGLQARKIYKGWRTSFGEPTEATALRAAHEKLMQVRKELKSTTEVDRRLFIEKQIEILQEERNDLFVKIRNNVFEAAKQLATKDLAAYNDNIHNKERLAYAENYLSDEQSIIAYEEQELAHSLLYMTAYQRSLNVPTAQIIKELVGCDAPTADFLAQQVDSMHSDLNNPSLQQHENVEQISDDKGKEEEIITTSSDIKKPHTEVLSKPQRNASDTEEENEDLDTESVQLESSSSSSSSSNGIFGWWSKN